MLALISSMTSLGRFMAAESLSECEADILVYALGATALTRMPTSIPSPRER